MTSPPLSEAGRTAAFDAVRGSYERVNLHWPGRVFWASSPLAGELLAAELARRYTPRADRLRRIASWLGGMALPIVAGALLYGGSAAVCAGWTSVWAWVMAPDSALASDSDVPWRGAWIGVAAAGLLLAVGLVVSMVRYTDDGYARDGMGFFIAVMTGLSGAFVFPAFLGGLAGAFVGHLLDATGGGPPRSWVTTLLIATAAGTTLAAAVLGSMVKWQATSPRPLRHVDSAYGRLRRNYFDSAGSYGVDVALARTVDWTARARRPWIWRYPVEHFDRQSGHEGWWWPHREFVVIAEPTVTRHIEEVGEEQRLHRTDGPAATWPDGYRVYALHGVVVPAELVENGGDLPAIHQHPNTEVRRAAIDLIGWASYIEQAGWRLVATVPDPGNPPHELALYEDPRRRLRGVRVLVMTNGSPATSGEVLRYAETVPESIEDPVEAAAWQYGCPPEVYRELQRRT